MLRLTWRNLLARKVRLLMSALAIVLGIGFLAGVMTFSTGLNATFDNIVKGSTSDAVVRPAGDVQGAGAGVSTTQLITPDDIDKLDALPEVEAATGSVDGIGSFLLGQDGKLVGGQGAPTLAFNYAAGENMQGEKILQLNEGRWPEKPGEITIDSSSAERGSYSVGDTVTMIVPTAQPRRTFTLVGTADFNGGGTAGATLVLLDTEEAQEIFLDGNDAFTSVALTGADGVSQSALAAAADAVVPEGFAAVTGDSVVKETQEQIGQFLDVISIFLTTFAVIAIVVGAFIIFNTFSILVSQRVRESALLRALGASKKQVTRSVLVEAFLMSVVGATLGLLLGLGLARLLASLFRTFGLDIAGEVLTLTPFTIASGYIVGIVVTMVAAYVPARRAAKVPPVAAMRDDLVVQEKAMGRRMVLGTIAMVIGIALAVAGLVGAPGTDAIWIGAGAVIWVVTTAVLAPVLGHPVLVACRAVFGRLFGTAGRLAGENALRNPRRTGATASALMIGLAVVSAVGVLASSLSATNDATVDDVFKSDFLVQMPTFQGFPSQYGDQMEDVDGVDLVSRQQGTPVSVEVDGEPDRTFAIGVDPGFFEIYDLTMVSGDESISGQQALLSEGRADDLKAGPGDTIEVEFPGGKTISLEVMGVFEDTPDHKWRHRPALGPRGRRHQAQRLDAEHHPAGRRRPRGGEAGPRGRGQGPADPRGAGQGGVQGADQRPGQPAALRHLRPARPRRRDRRHRHRQHARTQRDRADPRDRTAAGRRAVPLEAADHDHPGIGGDRAARRRARHGAGSGHRDSAASVAQGRPDRALAAGEQPARLPRGRGDLRGPGRDRPGHPGVADEGAGGHRDRVTEADRGR